MVFRHVLLEILTHKASQRILQSKRKSEQLLEVMQDDIKEENVNLKDNTTDNDDEDIKEIEDRIDPKARPKDGFDGGMEIVIREHSQSVLVTDIFSEPMFTQVFGLKFDYLTYLYDKYRQKTDNMYKDKDYHDTKGINEIAQEIYLQFIADDADHIVNISWNCRDELREFFNDCTEVRGPLYQFTIGSFQSTKPSGLEGNKSKTDKTTQKLPQHQIEMNDVKTNSVNESDRESRGITNESGSGSKSDESDYKDNDNEIEKSDNKNGNVNDLKNTENSNPNIHGKTEIELIHKYLGLFNNSIIEVYGLMASVFQFRYRRFIKQRGKSRIKSSDNVLSNIPE